MPNDNSNDLASIDDAYTRMFSSVQDFFRYEKRHLDTEVKFDDEYYARVAAVLKRRIDHELLYLREMTLN